MVRSRGDRAAVLACVLGAGVLLLAGCSSSVDGQAVPAPGQIAPASATSNLSAALPGQSSFPAGYTATPLPQSDAREAATDLSGVPTNARVNPLRCRPPRLPANPADLAMASATSAADGSVLAVVLTRVDAPLTALSGQIERCTELTTTQFGATATLRRTKEPAPSVPGADATFVYGQTTTSGPTNLQLTQTTLTELAQVGDVRAAVTFMTQRGAMPDRKALTDLLAATVANLHR